MEQTSRLTGVPNVAAYLATGFSGFSGGEALVNCDPDSSSQRSPLFPHDQMAFPWANAKRAHRCPLGWWLQESCGIQEEGQIQGFTPFRLWI